MGDGGAGAGLSGGWARRRHRRARGRHARAAWAATSIVVDPRHERLARAGASNTLSSLDVRAWAGPAVARFGRLEDSAPVIVRRTPGMERPHPYNDPAHRASAGTTTTRGSSASPTPSPPSPSSWRPDVVHLNDWHAAAATAWLAESHADRADDPQPRVPGPDRPRCGSTGWARTSDAFDRDGCANPLAGGIALADRVVAVSPTYAAETRRRRTGAGLDELLRDRGHAYSGIRNGIDVERWDPATDPYLPAQFYADSTSTGRPTSAAALCDVAGSRLPTTNRSSAWCAASSTRRASTSRSTSRRQLRGLGARLVILWVAATPPSRRPLATPRRTTTARGLPRDDRRGDWPTW